MEQEKIAKVEPMVPLHRSSHELQALDDFHSSMTISLGELLHDGIIVWTMPELDWRQVAYDDTQFWRTTQKVQEHYFERDIGILPVRAWMRAYRRFFYETMPKMNLIYKALDDGVDFMRVADDYGKSRRIGSAFPATQLKSNQDYASDAADNEYENIHEGNYFTQAELWDAYTDPDLYLVNRCERLFSSMFTATVPLY